MSIINIKPKLKSVEAATQFATVYANKGFGKNVLGVSHEEFIHFIRIGKLCELAFATFLKQEHIDFDASEILIPHEGNHKKGADLILNKTGEEVDIKAANKDFHKRILIREDQFQAHIHDIYIGAKYVSDEEIEFHGYVTGQELKQIEPKDFGYGLCRYMMLDSLNSMEKFVEKYK